MLLFPPAASPAVPDGADFPKKDASGCRPDVLELLQFGRELRRCLGMREEICEGVVTALQLLADIKQLGRSGEIIPDVFSLIEQDDELVPTSMKDGLGSGQVFRQKPLVGALRNFCLNWLPKKQASEKPLKELFFFLRSQVDAQVRGLGDVCGHTLQIRMMNAIVKEGQCLASPKRVIHFTAGGCHQA